MEWKLFADLAETAGNRSVTVEAGAGDTVGEALEALFEARPALRERVVDEDGEILRHINVLRNGEAVADDGGLSTVLDEGDELALFPPVSGG